MSKESSSKSSAIVANNDKICGLLKHLCRLEEGQVGDDVNSAVFICVLAVAKNIGKHSVMQVRQLLFKQLEKLTLQKQQKPSEQQEEE